ncbi:MAG: hypothetical protein P8Z74_19155 [Acidobacteriota bacterium]
MSLLPLGANLEDHLRRFLVRLRLLGRAGVEQQTADAIGVSAVAPAGPRRQGHTYWWHIGRVGEIL